MASDILKRLIARVIINEHGCWLWQGAKDSDGYGNVRYKGHVIKAHRATWLETKGSIPTGFQLDHRCTPYPRRSCINPDHLHACPAYDNVMRGSHVKLNDETVQLILDLAVDDYSLTYIYEQVQRRGIDISKSQVAKVIRRHHWKHIGEPTNDSTLPF